MGAQELKGFIPAKAIIFAGTGTASAAGEPSQITGLRYKQRNGSSYTIPYGASVGKPKEVEVRAAIKAVLTQSPNATISFKSERL